MYDPPPSDESFVELYEYKPYDGTDGLHHPCFPVQPAQVDTEHTSNIDSD
jgi:hypothetical protein